MITDVELLRLAKIGAGRELSYLGSQLSAARAVGRPVEEIAGLKASIKRLENIREELERKLGDFETEVRTAYDPRALAWRNVVPVRLF